MTVSMPEALRARAAVLAAPALAFAERELAQETLVFGTDGTGLLCLVRRVVAFAFEDDVDEERDRQFVEGAGALLGVLLIAHTPHGGYRGRGQLHLVQLSEFGVFDPFHAIDSALSAGNVRTELLRHIREAEAEARGEGPLSRVAHTFAAALANTRPELRIIASFAAELRLAGIGEDSFTLDLTQTVAATRDASLLSVQHSVSKLIAMLPGAPSAQVQSLASVRSQLFPRVAHVHTLAELSERAGAVLFGVPVTDELVAALVVEENGRARYVRAAEVTAWGLAENEALALAKENLALASQNTRVVREDTADGPIFAVRSGDGRDSARVLLSELRTPIEARVGPYAAVCLPHRDVLLACDGRVAPLVQRLRERSEADAQRAPHRVSSTLYVLHDDGLRVLGADEPISSR